MKFHDRSREFPVTVPLDEDESNLALPSPALPLQIFRIPVVVEQNLPAGYHQYGPVEAHDRGWMAMP